MGCIYMKDSKRANISFISTITNITTMKENINDEYFEGYPNYE